MVANGDSGGVQERTAPRKRSPLGRWLRRAGILVVVLGMVFYGGGGWYFASQLGTDAFEVESAGQPTYDVGVSAIDTESITLAAEAGSEHGLTATQVYGFETAGGRIRLGPVISSEQQADRDVVTRSFELLDGTAPAVGDLGDVDGWVYPNDPALVVDGAIEVSFPSESGDLDAWEIPGDGSTWLIMVHGKGADRRETLRLMSVAGSAPMLSITYRNDPGQPADPSGYYRYGVTEWRDLEAAVAYAVDHGAERVVLCGLSTGAALSLSFLYRSDLADRVAGLIFDSPNIDFGRTVDYGASRRDLPLVGLTVPQSLATAAKLIGSVRFDVDWSELDYIDRIDEVSVPMLVFHGTADTTVPLDVSTRLAEARPDLVTLVVVDNAEHVESWNMDPVAYGEAVRDFLGALGA